jgi:hypothetical protein
MPRFCSTLLAAVHQSFCEDKQGERAACPSDCCMVQHGHKGVHTPVGCLLWSTPLLLCSCLHAAVYCTGQVSICSNDPLLIISYAGGAGPRTHTDSHQDVFSFLELAIAPAMMRCHGNLVPSMNCPRVVGA